MGDAPERADRIALGRIEPLSHDERLVLAALAQHYLRFEPDPHPAPRTAIARQLRALVPGGSWSEERVDHVLDRIGLRSALLGSHGDTGLAVAVVAGAVLTPVDLRLLEGHR